MNKFKVVGGDLRKRSKGLLIRVDTDTHTKCLKLAKKGSISLGELYQQMVRFCLENM